MLQARAFKHVVRSSQFRTAKGRQYSSLPSHRIKSPYVANSLLSKSRSPLCHKYAAPFAASLVTSGGIRFQSTSIPSLTASEPLQQIPTGTPVQDNTSNLFEDLSNTTENLQAIAPHYNMLREAGIDLGWGVSTTAQYIVESLHVFADMPWWAALASTALMYRAIFFIPLAKSSNMGAIAQAIAPAQREIQARYKAMDMDQRQAMQLMQKGMKYLHHKTGYSLKAHYGPIVLQGVLSFGLFRFTRHLALIPDIGLSDGGFLWLSNLHYPDPFYTLPLLTAVVMHTMARHNFAQAKAAGSMVIAEGSWVHNAMLYGLPAVSIIFLSFLPAATQIPLSILSMGAALSQILIRWPWMRKSLNLAPFPEASLMRTTIDVHGRASKNGAAAATPTNPLDAIKTSFGLPADGAVKQTTLEKTRGKDMLKSAQQYDANRRKRLQEKEMRDRF